MKLMDELHNVDDTLRHFTWLTIRQLTCVVISPLSIEALSCQMRMSFFIELALNE